MLALFQDEHKARPPSGTRVVQNKPPRGRTGHRGWGQGSLTTSAKQVGFADIHVEVGEAKATIINVGLFLLSITQIVKGALALLWGFVGHGAVKAHAVDTVRRCRKRRGDGRHGRVDARQRIGAVGRRLRWALRGLRVEGHG